MLPVAGTCHAGHSDSRITTHRIDEKPGRCHPRIRGGKRGNRTLPELIIEQSPNRGGSGRPDFRSHETPLCGTGKPYEGREHRYTERNKNLILRSRRSTLYIRLGTRLQTGIP